MIETRSLRRLAGVASVALFVGGLAAVVVIGLLKGEVGWRAVAGDLLGACLVEIAAAAFGFFTWRSAMGKVGAIGGLAGAAAIATFLVVLITEIFPW